MRLYVLSCVAVTATALRAAGDACHLAADELSAIVRRHA